MRRSLLVLPILLGAACATRGDLQEIRTELRTLSARQDSATAGLRRLVDDANRATMDSVRVLSEAIFNFRGDASGNLSDVQKEVVRLLEVVGHFQREQDRLREEIDSMGRELQRIDRMAAPPDSTGEGVADEVADTVDPLGATAEERALFDGALTHLGRGLYTSAHRGFTQFLQEYPGSALAPDAYLHRGEALTHEGRLEEAIADYIEVPRMFPASERIPAALYRAGVLCIELEDYDRAREYLERVVNTYPDHAFAEQARGKLDDIP